MSIPGGKKSGKEAQLYKELLAAMKRGLDCKVILNYTTPENKIIKQNIGAAQWLRENGIECKAVGRNRTVHAKMIIVDGVTVILGSHNWSERAMTRNIEASVQVNEHEIVKYARENFLKLWDGSISMEEGK